MDADVGRYTRVKPLKGPDDERTALCSTLPSGSTPATASSAASAASAAARAASAARAVYFCLGAGLLAAWNALITGTDYFGAVYPGWHTDRLFTLAYLPLCMISLGVAIRYPDILSLAGRIRLGYVGFTACMAAVPLLDALLVAPATAASGGGAGGEQPQQQAEAPVGALVAVLVCVAVVGVCDGLCQGALFGEAAQLPPPYTQAVVAGTASSGLLVCLLRIASKASFEAAAAAAAARQEDGRQQPGSDASAAADAATRAGLRNGTRLYFALAGLLSFACLILYDFVLPGLRRRAGGALAAAAAARERDRCAAAGGSAAALERQPLLLQEPYHIDSGAGAGVDSMNGCGPGLAAADGTSHSNHSRAAVASVGGAGAGGRQGGGGSLPHTASAATLEVELSGDLGSVHGSEGAVAALVAAAAAGAPASGPAAGNAGAGGAVAASVPGGGGAAVGPLPVSKPAHQHHHQHHHSTNFAYPSSGVPPPAANGEAAAAVAATAETSQRGFRAAQLAGCVAAAWPLCAALFATYGVTLSIFPGFLAEDVHSADLGDWYPILLITAFNAADLVGKTLPCVTPLPPQPPASTPAGARSGSSLAQRSAGGGLSTGAAAALFAAGAGAGTGTGRGQGLAARLAAAALAPLRRPRGMLAVSLVRGGVALPAFLAAAAWQAPVAVMALLTALLGLSNGYLTSQLMTMGPSSVLARPLLDSGASDSEEDSGSEGGDVEGTGVGAGAGAGAGGAEEAGTQGIAGMEEGRSRRLGAGLGRGPGGGAGGGEGYVALPSVPVPATATAAVALGSSSNQGKLEHGRRGRSAGKASRQEHQLSSHEQQQHEHHQHQHHPHHADAEVVENLLVLSLVAGLNVGAVLGWLWLLRA